MADEKAPAEPEQQTLDHTKPHSVNEPPGSEVHPDVPDPLPEVPPGSPPEVPPEEPPPDVPAAAQTQHRGTQTQTLPHRRAAPPPRTAPSRR